MPVTYLVELTVKASLDPKEDPSDTEARRELKHLLRDTSYEILDCWETKEEA